MRMVCIFRSHHGLRQSFRARGPPPKGVLRHRSRNLPWLTEPRLHLGDVLQDQRFFVWTLPIGIAWSRVTILASKTSTWALDKDNPIELRIEPSLICLASGDKKVPSTMARQQLVDCILAPEPQPPTPSAEVTPAAPLIGVCVNDAVTPLAELLQRRRFASARHACNQDLGHALRLREPGLRAVRYSSLSARPRDLNRQSELLISPDGTNS